MTVPAYQSNELQVSLDWGEFSISINWVGDEFWSHTVELPTNTQALLNIAFLGENGGIKLGSFEQQFKTGSNAAEVFTISADQFDTDQWDGQWRYVDDYGLFQEFTSEISANNDTYRLVESGNGSWNGTHQHMWETLVDVTGQLIEDTEYCEVTSGTITESYT